MEENFGQVTECSLQGTRDENDAVYQRTNENHVQET